MYISKLEVRNWKNFTRFEANMGETVFVIGPNASGKSNFLDIFRFMRDIVKPNGGGLQYALDVRHGLAKVRSLAARRHPPVELSFTLTEERPPHPGGEWRYTLAIVPEGRGKHRPLVAKEEVLRDGEVILSRPTSGDAEDAEQLTVTYLEQVHLNREFRCIADYFQDILYLHLVPQLLKYGSELAVNKIESDPFGQGFLEEIAKTPDKTRIARLDHIEGILHAVIPNFTKLEFERDAGGRPHLKMRYAHWRPNAGWQMEDQFSDGTLRLIAILWILLSNKSMILLEEPELSLHTKIVEQIPRLIHKARRYVKKAGGQLVISTHSEALLSDKSIDANFMILKPGTSGESTIIETPSEDDGMAMAAGLSPADILLPRTGESIGLIDL
jgi:ABC-type lipoprotein export system ATPase subunit